MEIITLHKQPTSLLIILFAFAISISSCRKDNDEECCDPTNPECPNYDSCYGVEEPTAEIIMRELYLFDGLSKTPPDSVFANEVEFSSPFINDDIEHTWYLGAEVINEPVFSRTHSGVPRPANITVSHVIEYPVDNECYPNSTGRDSTNATYYLIEYYYEFLTYGKFRGAFENETDSFDFEFSVRYPDFSHVAYPGDLSLEPESYAFNFNNEGDTITSEDLTLAMKGRNLIGHLSGSGTFSPRGTYTINPENRKEARFEYTHHGEDFIVNARILD
ncbi:hypothetical protein [Halocola ammonii]